MSSGGGGGGGLPMQPGQPGAGPPGFSNPGAFVGRGFQPAGQVSVGQPPGGMEQPQDFRALIQQLLAGGPLSGGQIPHSQIAQGLATQGQVTATRGQNQFPGAAGPGTPGFVPGPGQNGQPGPGQLYGGLPYGLYGRGGPALRGLLK